VRLVTLKHNQFTDVPVLQILQDSAFSVQNCAALFDRPYNLTRVGRIAKKSTAPNSETNRRKIRRLGRVNDVATQVTASHFTVLGNTTLRNENS
jgi:hypothetical protein